MSNLTCSSKGLLLPIFSDEESWNKGVRALLYFVAMIWCFFGIAIVADTFMCGIEHITSRTRTVLVPHPARKDSHQQIEVKVWNDTVANLSLLAFGTSAPEILLSVIETLKNRFESGELGPGTIVGSAAYNSFCITAICILCVPDGETRRLKNMHVFGVTSFTGIFAYVWLIVVLLWTSPKEVELWEALVTFFLFPALIVTAYAADRGLCCVRNKTASELEIGVDVDSSSQHNGGSADIMEVAKEFQKETHLSEEQTAKILAAKLATEQPKGSGWYRVSATRILTGGHRLIPKVNASFDGVFDKIRAQTQAEARRKASATSQDPSQLSDKAVVEFTSSSCAVLENEGHVRLGIRRYGNMDKEIKIGVETIDGTAVAGEDYKPLRHLVVFAPRDALKDVFVEIVDDDVWEPDEFFYVRLVHDSAGSSSDDVVIGKVSINQVTIVNDDEPGKLEFSKPSFIVRESADKVELAINRVSGADGEVTVKWMTRDMSANTGIHYVGGQGIVTFAHGETSKLIELRIIGTKATEHEPNFQAELLEPTGGAVIGKVPRAIVTIINDEEFTNMMSRIAARARQSLVGQQLDTSSWGEQLSNAMNVNGGQTETATTLDYFLHFVTFFWKVLFACIPPTTVGGGWLTFLFALLCIGLLTAIVSDLATIFGCVVGLSEFITAITFVAIGTSMPDTFASRAAALNEKWADSAIGNINGSNAVNVFLGLGLPWLMSAVYWEIKGGKLTVDTDSLGFGVTLFTVFALLTNAMLLARRKLPVFGGGELGGARVAKWVCTTVIALFWVIHVLVCSLQAQKTLHVGF